MKYVFTETDSKMVTMMIAFDAGARAEGQKYSMGIAHMLEHMMFKGTEKRSYLDIPRDVAFLGGDINAYTNYEMVCYYIRIPYENFEKGMEILSDIVWNSKFPKEEFLKEREVVLEEALSYKDQIQSSLYEAFNENFNSGRFSTDIIGTEESIKGFTWEELVSFYNEFYKPSAAVLSISGAIKKEDMIATSEKLFGPEDGFVKTTKSSEVAYKNSRKVIIDKPNLEQSYVWIAYPGLEINNEDSMAVTVLLDILGSGMDSRLFTEVREKNNLCYSIGSSSSSYLDRGDIIIYSSTRKDNVDKMLKLVYDEVEKIRNEEVTDEELARAINKSRSDIYSIYDSGSSMCKFELNRIFNGTKSLEDISKEIQGVTKEDVKMAANKYFKEDNKMTFIMQS